MTASPWDTATSSSWDATCIASWHPPARRTVVVSPHPDDEVLATGGLILHQRARDLTVVVVAVTDGERAYRCEDRSALAAVRRSEQQMALADLGVEASQIVRLGLPDGAVAGRHDELRRALQAVVAPGDLLVAPWEHDHHADHEACGRAARTVAEEVRCALVGSLVWAPLRRAPPEPPTALLRLELGPASARARTAALARHFSQLTHPEAHPVVGDELLQRVRRPEEMFVDVTGGCLGDGDGAVDPTATEFFEAKYRRSADPWGFASEPYERGRYRAILDLIRPYRFARGFEAGCSIGELTVQLAPFCGELVATDTAATAVAAARRRCRHRSNVDVRRGHLPRDMPEGHFDLIVFSEIGYYFEAAVLAELIEALVDRLPPGGRLVAAHWLGTSPDHVLAGRDVHARIDATDRLRRIHVTDHDGFTLGAWTRRP